MLGIANNTKRRRYIRYAIELEATLQISDSITVPCVIQDFCSGGLFLGFKQPLIQPAFSDLKFVKISFSMSPEHGWEDFQLDAEVMHVSTNGMGLAINNMPPSAFNALKNEANSKSKTLVLDRRNTSSDKLNQDNFKIELKKILDEQLPQLLVQFFENFGDGLMQSLEHSPDFKDRSTLDDLITTIKFKQESIISEFCYSILIEVDNISDSRQRKDGESILDGKTLALIEKEDFEDWLNLSAIIRKLTNLYKDRIHQIEEKLSHVIGIPAHAINNPVSPGIFCDTFRETILQFNLTNDTKNTLYILFENILTNGLGPLFDQLDKILVNFGAPEQLVRQIIRQPDQSPNTNRQRESSTLNHEHSSQSMPYPSSTSNNELLNLLQITEQQNVKPVAQVARKLLDILKETSGLGSGETDNKNVKNSDKVVQNQAFFTASEVVTAISKIQQDSNNPSNLHHNSLTLQKLLQDTLENSATKQKTLSSADIKQLEVYGKLFETVFNDLKVSSEIKSYIESIHLTLLSLTLQGNDFIDSESHPARKVLNQLATLESAVKSSKVIKKTNIKHTLDNLVTRISAEANTNPNIFKEVEQELNEITVQVSRSIDLNNRRLVETYEGQQKLEAARQLVQQEIDNRITGKHIPKIISMLLSSGWQHLILMAELNQEQGKDDKPAYLKVIENLISWLSDQNAISEAQTGDILSTLEFIEDQLGSVCTNVFLRDSILEELNFALIGVGKPPIRKPVEIISIEPTPFKVASSGQLNDDKWTLQVEQLRVGEWLTIFRNSSGFEPMKLIWIGDFLQILVFTDRDGLNELKLTKLELAELMRSGGANKTENLDVPLMDRATNTMLQKMHEKLIYNAIHDPVTDLYTRDEFIKQLKHELSQIGTNSHVLCQIEIQDYRMISNICGGDGSNQLLKNLTHILTEQLRNEEIFARLGDQTFGILFKHCSPDDGYAIAKKLLIRLSEAHFSWDSKSYPIHVSMGLTPVLANGYEVHELLQQTDAASVSAKHGSNSIQLFKEEDENFKLQNKVHEWAGQIDSVLSENRLFIRCQMIASIDPDKNDHTHYEILMGIRDTNGNIVPPDHFIPAAERCNRMPEIDQWMIRNVFNWIEKNRNYFDQMNGFSINLSGQSINSEEFLAFLKDLLVTSNVPPQKLTFEITETVAADSLVYVKKFIKQIKQFGCKFSLDDFGSGYSSYAYLKSLNVDYLKIDGAFVKDIANNKADVAIVKSMNEIAHSLGMETIAEYVENNEIYEILKVIGVDFVQGFGIQKPILISELLDGQSTTEITERAKDHSVTKDNAIMTDPS